jgi:putative exosortase-associated protein (TIGR04073 family)
MKKLSMLLVVLLLVGSLPIAGWAASPWTTETVTADKMMGKLGFGIKNLLLGWTEIIKQPVNGAKTDSVVGFGKGLATGLYDGVIYTLGGALHVVTFPFTNIDVPLPNDGVKCPITGK